MRVGICSRLSEDRSSGSSDCYRLQSEALSDDRKGGLNRGEEQQGRL